MTTVLDKRSRTHWHALTEDEQRAAVRNLAALEYSPYVIASATGLSVEMVRTIIGELETKG